MLRRIPHRRCRLVSSFAGVLAFANPARGAVAAPLDGWHGIRWGSSLATVRLSQPLVPRPLTPTPGIVAGPPCYAPAFLHPAAYVLPKGYALDSTTFGVTFCFYDNHLSSVNMLGVATLDNQVRSTLPAELATRYGPPIFSGADLNQSNGQLTRWTTRASDIALNIKDVVVANAQVRSILLLYNSSAFLNEVRQTLARQRQEIR